MSGSSWCWADKLSNEKLEITGENEDFVLQDPKLKFTTMRQGGAPTYPDHTPYSTEGVCGRT